MTDYNEIIIVLNNVLTKNTNTVGTEKKNTIATNATSTFLINYHTRFFFISNSISGLKLGLLSKFTFSKVKVL